MLITSCNEVASDDLEKSELHMAIATLCRQRQIHS